MERDLLGRVSIDVWPGRHEVVVFLHDGVSELRVLFDAIKALELCCDDVVREEEGESGAST